MSGTASPTPPAPLTPDLCVIGAGTAGLAVATAAAAFGVPVVLVERDRMGGETGSSAIAALASAGARAQAIRDAGRFGIVVAEPDIRDAALHDHVQRVLAARQPNVSAERLTALGATVISGEARFVSRSTVAVGDQTIRARRFVVATGARAITPDIPGLADLPVLTEASLASLTRRPESLIVIGGSPAAAAIAQALARLGSRVALVEPASLLPGEDPEAVAILRRTLLREGVGLHENRAIRRAEAAKGGLRLVLDGDSQESETVIDAGQVLIAGPHLPAIEKLDLELAGIASGPTGIRVDRGLRSTNRRVYAIGDCAAGAAGGPTAAEEQARLVLRNALFRQGGRFDPAAIPRVTATQPPIAHVGLSEAEAQRQGEIRVLRWPYAESDAAQADRTTEGFVKILTDAKGKLLGATVVGPQAGELIASWGLALAAGRTVQDMAALPMPQPSLAEVSKRAATSFLTPLATKPGLRRLIGWLRRLG
ncbi:pyruvate/2-oxoglutarate dehydrogenase complex dihydrolipoamide dehydrogenase (E3) component [Bosea sp. OAE506]|uniref:FAD-dependent oxidoreductase n=1 Tax=Bosea sp. OAE506 TaxID=2663870 RepID=UPI001789E0BB